MALAVALLLGVERLRHDAREGFANTLSGTDLVVGARAPTGTPVDRAVLVSLESMEAIHLDWQGGAAIPGMGIPLADLSRFDLTPKAVTAVLVGLKSRGAVFRVQRGINDYRGEPLLAVLPGVTVDQLWQVVGVAEQVLLASLVPGWRRTTRSATA